MIISIKNITKRFGRFEAVKDLSIEIKEGEIYGLLGSNGAGKSTTINILLGFLEPDEGEAFIDGINVTTHADSCLLYTSPSPRDAHESRMPSSA